MYDFLQRLDIADKIQIFIFLVIAWYSWETRLLRKWQKKQVQLTILGLDMQRVRNVKDGIGYEGIPIIVRKIYELGKFDAKDLYSPGHHQPLTLFDKIKSRIKKYYKK